MPEHRCPDCNAVLEPWPSRPRELVCPTPDCPMEHRTVKVLEEEEDDDA
jgi:hypothetical protein